ncbi:MAG: retron St85 family effector protein, partial [Blastocatellia bacterium]
MGHPFMHPKGRELLKRVALLFKSERIYIRQNSHIVFVCGGRTTNKKTMRRRFLDYSNSSLPNHRIFLAEVADKDLVSHSEPEIFSVAEFETLISQVSDCIILFPESPGSFAELGYFANNPEITKRLLVANDADLQGEDSFIARGPILEIDRASVYAPTIQLDQVNPNFDLIKKRLDKWIGERRKKFEFKKHGDLEPREGFFSVFEILRLFPCLTLEGVEFAYRSIFSNVNPREIRQFISIMVAAEYVMRCGPNGEHFIIQPSISSFLDFNGQKAETLKLEVIDFYSEHARDLAAL